METCSERRKRKLAELAQEKGGLKVLAADCGLSYGSLDQILKGVPLPPKADGSRSERSLGDDAARSIEMRYGLERGWFDSDPTPAADTPENLAAALGVLTKALQEADESILIAVAPLLSAMASDPANAKNKSALILKLLVADRDKSHEPSQDRVRQPHISVNLGVLDLGDDNNGRRDTDAAASGRKK
jgi:hypothetical protein